MEPVSEACLPTCAASEETQVRAPVSFSQKVVGQVMPISDPTKVIDCVKTTVVALATIVIACPVAVFTALTEWAIDSVKDAAKLAVVALLLMLMDWPFAFLVAVMARDIVKPIDCARTLPTPR